MTFILVLIMEINAAAVSLFLLVLVHTSTGIDFCSEAKGERPALQVCVNRTFTGADGQIVYVDSGGAPNFAALTCKCDLKFTKSGSLSVKYRTAETRSQDCGMKFTVGSYAFNCQTPTTTETFDIVGNVNTELVFTKTDATIPTLLACIGINATEGAVTVTCHPTIPMSATTEPPPPTAAATTKPTTTTTTTTTTKIPTTTPATTKPPPTTAAATTKSTTTTATTTKLPPPPTTTTTTTTVAATTKPTTKSTTTTELSTPETTKPPPTAAATTKPPPTTVATTKTTTTIQPPSTKPTTPKPTTEDSTLEPCSTAGNCIGGTCTQSQGSASSCVCPTRYTLNGTTCTEDPCKTDGACVNGTCTVQTRGELSKCVCNAGFSLDDKICKENEKPKTGALTSKAGNDLWVIGLVIAILVIIALIIIIICCVRRRRRRELREKKPSTGPRSVRYLSTGDDVVVTENELYNYDGENPAHATNAVFIGGIPDTPGATSSYIPHFSTDTGERYAVIMDSTRTKNQNKERPSLKTFSDFAGSSKDSADVADATDTNVETDKDDAKLEEGYREVTDSGVTNPAYDPEYLVPYDDKNGIKPSGRTTSGSSSASPYDYIDHEKLKYDDEAFETESSHYAKLPDGDNDSIVDKSSGDGTHYKRFISSDSSAGPSSPDGGYVNSPTKSPIQSNEFQY